MWSPVIYPELGTWPATQAPALTGNRTRDPLGCRPALSPLSHTSQGQAVGFSLHQRDAQPGNTGETVTHCIPLIPQHPLLSS